MTRSLAAYYDALARFDWDYDATDDGEVWRAADAQRRLIESQSRQSEAHRRLYEAYRNHEQARSARANGCNVVLPPKPERPVESEAA